jgi:hypothetical protein
MKALHTALMGTLIVGMAAVALGTIHPGIGVATAQHGHGSAGQQDEAQDPAAHMEHLATQLELTAEQREQLAEPLHAAFAAMQELHQAHAVISEGLTEEQRTRMAAMMHEMMGGMMGGDMHEDGAHHEGDHGAMHQHGGMHQDGDLHGHGNLH